MNASEMIGVSGAPGVSLGALCRFRDRSGAEFARMVGHVVKQYPFAKTIHLVMDNLNSHSRNSLINYYGEQEGGYLWDRLTVHYTPKHGSWLNQAEIELSMYTRQCLGK